MELAAMASTTPPGGTSLIDALVGAVEGVVTAFDAAQPALLSSLTPDVLTGPEILEREKRMIPFTPMTTGRST
jgi:hypothetical protein